MGHGWLPFSGEALAEMARTGRAPTEFFRPLTNVFDKGYNYMTAAIHVVSDSTLCFYEQCSQSSWGYKLVSKDRSAVSMRFHRNVHGHSSDIKSGCDGEVLWELCDQFDWKCNALVKNGQFEPGKHTPIELSFGT